MSYNFNILLTINPDKQFSLGFWYGLGRKKNCVSNLGGFKLVSLCKIVKYKNMIKNLTGSSV